MKKQKMTTTVIGGLVAAITSTLVFQYMKKRNDPTSNEYLNEVASELNKSLPMMVDKETELFSTVGIDKSIQYNYRLVNLVKENISIGDIVGMKPSMINRNCTTPETKLNFLEKGIKMIYKYYDKENNHLTDITIDPSDCR